MKRIIFLAVFTCFTSLLTIAQNPTAFEMNQRLGRGINMGNAFEAPTETAWGNPWNPDYFRIIAELGFSHVRIPIRWDTPERSMDAPPYTIDPAFLNRIQHVVDVALRYGLHPIINMHHHNTLFENPQQERARFIAQWVQIAQFFRNYPDSLIFEVMNEPHNNLTPALWNQFFAEALSIIRQTNPTRIVLMGTAAMGGLSAVRYLQIPNDPNLILTLHYYEPFQFTHQGASWVAGSNAWLGTRWHNTDAERQTIINEFGYAIEFARRHNIPIHIGEFGVYSTAHLDDRVRYTNFLARWFEEQGFSWAYWEFSARFGIYNPSTRQFLQPLVDALLRNPMPPAASVQATPVLNHNFRDGTSGWVLNTASPGSASMAIVQNRVNFNIPNGGTEGWHIQFGRGGIPITQGAMYRVTFSARSYHSPRDIVAYVGMAASPWASYSGHRNFTVSTDEREYSFTFTMSSPSDANARLAFDLGRSAVGLSISWIRIERLSIVPGGTVTPTPTPTPPIENYEIVVRALGAAGTEQMRLTVGGVAVATWTLTRSFAEYRVTTNRVGDINVNFINDASGRDVRVDWVRIAGATHQAEAQATNTGVWHNNTCGGTQSEWLNCNGFIGFAALRTTEIVVRALGTAGTEQINLTVGGNAIATWTLTRSFAEYRVTTNRHGGINVNFINDASGRDVRVDWVRIAGTTHQAEAQATNTGVWHNNACGGARSEWLHCNGFIGFATLRSAPVELEEIASIIAYPVDDIVDVKVFPNPAATDGRFTVALYGLRGLTTIRVVDLGGRVVKEHQGRDLSAVDILINAQQGVYIVHINNEQQSFVRKIVLK